jgi:hypothetical protein
LVIAELLVVVGLDTTGPTMTNSNAGMITISVAGYSRKSVLATIVAVGKHAISIN